MIVKEVRSGEGRYALEASVVITQDGVSVTMCSEDYSHVGAVALATPRPSQREPRRTSATVSVLTVLSREDDIIARDAAKSIASSVNRPTSVTVGIHVEHATAADIKELARSAQELTAKVVGCVREVRASWAVGGRVVASNRDGVSITGIDRDEAHRGEGILHRGFSIILYTVDGHAMLCRRSRNKRLWPGWLGDTCSGHVLPGESLEAAAERRLIDVIGSRCSLVEAGNFVYREGYLDDLCEHEYCTALVGFVPADYEINKAEVEEVVFADADAIRGYLGGNPEELCPWVRRGMADRDVHVETRALLRTNDVPKA